MRLRMKAEPTLAQGAASLLSAASPSPALPARLQPPLLLGLPEDVTCCPLGVPSTDVCTALAGGQAAVQARGTEVNEKKNLPLCSLCSGGAEGGLDNIQEQ